MDFSNIKLFQLAGSKLDYLAERHRLIAQNVVNANTPEYKSQDLKPFESMLGGMRAVVPERTAPMHLAGLKPAGMAREVNRPDAWEVTPDGNTVSLEQEMQKGAETRDSFGLTASLFQRNVQLLRAAWRANG
jgi:flagellar basal-body rod protein FlgB